MLQRQRILVPLIIFYPKRTTLKMHVHFYALETSPFFIFFAAPATMEGLFAPFQRKIAMRLGEATVRLIRIYDINFIRKNFVSNWDLLSLGVEKNMEKNGKEWPWEGK